MSKPLVEVSHVSAGQYQVYVIFTSHINTLLHCDTLIRHNFMVPQASDYTGGYCTAIY